MEWGLLVNFRFLDTKHWLQRSRTSMSGGAIPWCSYLERAKSGIFSEILHSQNMKTRICINATTTFITVFNDINVQNFSRKKVRQDLSSKEGRSACLYKLVWVEKFLLFTGKRRSIHFVYTYKAAAIEFLSTWASIQASRYIDLQTYFTFYLRMPIYTGVPY